MYISDEKVVQHDLQGDCVSGFTRYFKCAGCGQSHKIKMGCHSRWDAVCPYCSRKWRNRIKGRYGSAIYRMQYPVMLTLTLWHPKHSKVPALKLFQLWSMRKYLFRILRLRGYIIRSWCGVIEPPNHVHLIVDCEQIPKQEISEIWQSITGDSMIVDIKSLHNRGRAVHYVSKYITKTKNWSEYGIGIEDLKSVRVCQSDNLQHYDDQRYDVCLCGHCDLHPTGTSEYYSELEVIEYDDYKILISNQR